MSETGLTVLSTLGHWHDKSPARWGFCLITRFGLLLRRALFCFQKRERRAGLERHVGALVVAWDCGCASRPPLVRAGIAFSQGEAEKHRLDD